MEQHPRYSLTSFNWRELAADPIPISHRRFVHDRNTHRKFRRLRCLSGGSRWDWDKNVNPNRRSRFSDAYATEDDDDEDVENGSRSTAKQRRRRRWWADDYHDEEEDEGFGILEASIGFDWARKVFRAFGWMIPVVAFSLVLGTGPNTIVMAVALPLAQSALSLAADTLWGTSYETPRPKSNRSKKWRPSAGSKGERGSFSGKDQSLIGARSGGLLLARKEKEVRFQGGSEAGSYKSWMNEKNVRHNFGGWDELDKEPRVRPTKQAYGQPRVEEIVKVSRRTKGETPLLMRLLIAMFPYFGFWTKIF